MGCGTVGAIQESPAAPPGAEKSLPPGGRWPASAGRKRNAGGNLKSRTTYQTYSRVGNCTFEQVFEFLVIRRCRPHSSSVTKSVPKSRFRDSFPPGEAIGWYLVAGPPAVTPAVISGDRRGRCRPPYGESFRKIGFAKYNFLRLTGVWVTQSCRWYALFGQYVEILLKNPLWILDFCANSCIMECRLKMGGVYIGRTDRRAVR